MSANEYNDALAYIRHSMQVDCRCEDPITAFEALTWARAFDSTVIRFSHSLPTLGGVFSRVSG